MLQDSRTSRYSLLFSELLSQPSIVSACDDLPSSSEDKSIYALDARRFAVVLELKQSFFPNRLLQLVFLPLYNWKINKRFRNMGAISVRKYGVWPSLESPTFIFELDTPAELYAREYLIWADSSIVSQAIRTLIRLWSGCDPLIAAIIVVGEQR